MMHNYKKLRRIAAILLYSTISSIAFSGCSSKHIVLQPIEDASLGEMQGRYEHIPKPVAYEGEPLATQEAAFDHYLAKTFREIDQYKKELSGNKRYGKNRLHQDEKPHYRHTSHSTRKLSQEEKILYPSIEDGKKIKSTPLYGI